MVVWLRDLAAWMIGLAESPAGPIALFGLAFAEASVFPIPPDILLLGLDLLKPERSFIYAAICTAGSTMGGIAGYAIGRWGGRPILKRLFPAERILAIEGWFQSYDVWAVAVAGFTPIPYKIFTIAAGVFRLDVRRFAIASFISRGARFFLVSACVFAFGEQAKRFIQEYFEIFTIGFIVLLIGGFLVVRWITRSHLLRARP